MAIVRPTNTPDELGTAVRAAAELLRASEVVALPTETVYGLAANALDAAAVRKIFSIKGRPPGNPIIIHVASFEMARACVAEWTDLAERLARAFWPGPLTLVMRKSDLIPSIVTAGGETVGVRWPNHPVIEAIIRQCGFPLAAPSANRSSHVSPTLAEHVNRELGDRISLIVDGGPCDVGIESTVVDVSVCPPRLLRPGMIHAESLEPLTGKLNAGAIGAAVPLRSPGLLLKHYSPKAKLLIWAGTDEELQTRLAELDVALDRVHVLARTRLPPGKGLGRVSLMPREAGAFAKALYAEWHRADEAGAELIVMESVPEEPVWQAVQDRLGRAAASASMGNPR